MQALGISISKIIMLLLHRNFWKFQQANFVERLELKHVLCNQLFYSARVKEVDKCTDLHSLPFTGPGHTCFAVSLLKGISELRGRSTGPSWRVACMLLKSFTCNCLSPVWLVIIRLHEVGCSFFISDIMAQTIGYSELPIKRNCKSQSVHHSIRAKIKGCKHKCAWQ